MSVTVDQFWSLLTESHLLDEASVREVAQRFQSVPGASTQGNATTLAEWLIAEGHITRYHGTVLLSGLSGPFFYGEYKIVDRLSEGTLAGLFRAVHQRTMYPVMLRFLSGPKTQDPQALAGVSRQAAMASSVRENHLLRCFQFAHDGGYQFVVCEELTGEPLQVQLDGRPLPLAKACHVAWQLTQALAALHARGIYHGEVRPETIWIDGQSQVRLLQFPLVRDPFSSPGWETPGASASGDGSWADYTAPELTAGTATCNAACDIYSLGCTFYQMLSGQVPFAGGDVAEKTASHAKLAPRPLHVVQSQVPSPISKLVAYMMGKQPHQRYQTVADVQEALRAYVDPALLNALPEPPTPTRQSFEAWLRAAESGAAPRSHASQSQAPQSQAPQSQVPQPQTPQPEAPQAHGHPQAGGAGYQAAPPDPNYADPGYGGAHYADPNYADPNYADPGGPSPESGIPTPGEVPGAWPGPAEAPESFAVASPIQSGPDLEPLSSVRSPYRRRKKRGPQALIISLGVALVAVVGVIMMVNKQRAETTAGAGQGGSASNSQTQGTNSDRTNPRRNKTPSDSNSKTPGKPSPNQGTPEENANGDTPTETGNPTEADIELVDAESAALWVSPTAGSPLSLGYLPPGPQVFVFWRPAELLRQSEGRRLMESLGPFQRLLGIDALQSVGLPLDEIDSARISIYTQPDSSELEVCLVVRTVAPMTSEQLLAAWGDPQPMPEGDLRVYQLQGHAFYLPEQASEGDSTTGTLFVTGPIHLVMEAAKSGDSAPPLRREMETLLEHSDSDRMFNMLFAPNSLIGSTRPLFAAELAPFKEPLEWFFAGDIKGGLFSFHLTQDDFYLDLRLLGGSDEKPHELAKNMRQRVADLAPRAKNRAKGLDPSLAGAPIVERYPTMLRFLNDHTRSIMTDRETVLRAYLPVVAAHNLVLGSQLIANSPISGKPSTPDSTPKSAAQRLKKVVTLSFENNTLEHALEMLAEELEIEIHIEGNDLQVEGITRNKSFGIDAFAEPGDAILRRMFAKADPDGKLVYVFRTSPLDGQEVLHITTRAAVAKRGEKLPPELEEPAGEPPQ
jgi:serine/threonine protein kinase